MFFNAFKSLLANNKANKETKILIIDDNEVDMRVAQAAVERGGYTCIRAFDGKTGLSMAREQVPDLIILDYALPDTNGPVVCKTLKSENKTRHIPVLFLTSMDSPGSIVNCYEEGGENYLAKPIKPAFLLKQIQQILLDRK